MPDINGQTDIPTTLPPPPEEIHVALKDCTSSTESVDSLIAAFIQIGKKKREERLYIQSLPWYRRIIYFLNKAFKRFRR